MAERAPTQAALPGERKRIPRDEKVLGAATLHGAWIAGEEVRAAGFALWGEGLPLRPRRRRPEATRPPDHPFAMTTDALRHALSMLGLPVWATPVHAQVLTAYLPSLADQPLRSGHCGAQIHGAALKAWTVPVVMLPDVATLEVLPRLAAAARERDLHRLLGDDLRTWVAAARFALSLLARQRILPGVAVEHGQLQSRWSLVLDDPADQETLRCLEQALPGVAVALGAEEGAVDLAHSGGRTRQRTALHDFLAAAAGALVAQVRVGTGTSARSVSRVPDPFLAALATGRGGRLPTGPAAGLLASDVSAWLRQTITEGEPAASRLYFRLVPPAADTPGLPWQLDLYLQDLRDPAIVVPLADTWHTPESVGRAHLLHPQGDAPRERVLASLAQAARLFPPLRSVARDDRPGTCRLTQREATAFVQDAAVLLQDAGFGVELSGVQQGLGWRLRLGPADREEQQASSGLTLKRLVRLDWQVALGELVLSRADLEELGRQQGPLAQVRGQWVAFRPEQVGNVLAFVERHAGDAVPLEGAIAMAAAATSPVAGVPVTNVETEGWFGDLFADVQQQGAARSMEPPAGLNATLRDYQKRGLAWLASHRAYGLGAILADDMGLGKTIQTLGSILHGHEAGDVLGPTLVVCPTSVVTNWKREVERFTPSLRVLVHHGADRASEGAFARLAGEHDIVISTYALLHRDEQVLASVAWDGLVLDEAQNVKNPSTKAAQTARRLTARWRLALTGTPVENRLSDLWSIFHVTNPGYLGSYERFRRQFVLPIERAADAEATARLKSLVSPFLLRRLKTDRAIIADLPEKQEMKVYCTLTREQAGLYEAVVRDTLRLVDGAEGMQRRGLVLSLLTRLKQVCDHPALLLHNYGVLEGRSGKLARLAEMLEEVVAVDDRALVFTQYASMGTLLRDYLSERLGREVLYLHGATPLAERDSQVAAFQSHAGPPVFVISLRAGGTGLNLTRANQVFHFDRWWNPAVENQATDRAFRIGQQQTVQVHKFLCAGTYEEALDELIERKQRLAETVVGSSEAWLADLSTAELRQLFQLRPDAVAE